MDNYMNEVLLDEYDTESESSDISIDFYGILRDFIGNTVRHWLSILLIVSLLSSAGFVYEQYSYKPIYETSATFIVDLSNAVSYDNTSRYQQTMQQISKTFPNLLSTTAFQKMLIEDLGIDKFPDDLIMRVNAMSDTSLISIFIASPDPQLSFDTLQAVLNCYPKIAKYVLGNIEIEMIEYSGMPDEPVRDPEPKIKALYASFFGLVLCLGINLLYAFLKKTVRREKDLEELFNINCYGSIPIIPLKERSNDNNKIILFKHRGVGYEFNESIRTIRARIERDHVELGDKIYMISSALPGEGKSTVAANIAWALADAGRKVLLMDLDVRNSSILKVLGISDSVLSNDYYDLLERRVSFDEMILNSENKNLFILASKGINGNASEILAHSGIGELFDRARRFAEYVIVDTAPSSLLSDAAVLVEHMDTGIYVVCQDYAPIERIKDGIEMLSDGGLRISGCILNMKDTKLVGNGYNYGYTGNNYYSKNKEKG